MEPYAFVDSSGNTLFHHVLLSRNDQGKLVLKRLIVPHTSNSSVPTVSSFDVKIDDSATGGVFVPG
ncbi:MAG: hypothetical protein U5N86_13445 [Planctomycetota bacterium]|nr:hypothetical protein [Planctomycetota bacterium]